MVRGIAIGGKLKPFRLTEFETNPIYSESFVTQYLPLIAVRLTRNTPVSSQGRTSTLTTRDPPPAYSAS
jgi:hypothetical protein